MAFWRFNAHIEFSAHFADDKWLRELVASFCGDGRCPLRIVFPTEARACVRGSAGGAHAFDPI
eukprot:5584819-Pleurochrysis_carterae.AAC.1